MLYSPYPNPFNPVTHFKFDIPNLDAVNISVFDLSGKLTRTITNEEYRQGRYSLTWNGRNSQGKIVPTGIYFIQLTTSSFVQTKKALFLK
jgi:flagellar hook assembly protein FlgD